MTEPLHTLDASATVERLLDMAVQSCASDVHFDTETGTYRVRFRVDGLLEDAERLDLALGRACVTRLMVLSQLLTYRPDIPQEGRMRFGPHEMRVSVIPTVHGLRAVVRLPAELTQPRTLEQLRLGPPVTEGLRRFAGSEGGMLLLTGPAGSGKTTTIYALLSYIVEAQPGVSVVSLEDPVERQLPGVTQIEVTPHGQLTYERALKSILRQDPQVLMLGEIRDRDTASLAVQAALSGHRLIATLHAGSPSTAIARLLEMRIEPYQITSALYGVVSQRLLRMKHGPGYRGRVAVAELAVMNEPLRQTILSLNDASHLRQAIEKQSGYINLRQAASELIHLGLTDEPEVLRVLGTGS